MTTSKNMFQRYGIAIAIILVLSLLGLGIYQFMHHQDEKRLELASLVFEEMLDNIKKGDQEAALSKAEDLSNTYKNTPYAALGAMMMAKMELEKNHPKEAIEHLRSAVKVATKGPAIHFARVRLARVLAEAGQYPEALEILRVKDNEGFITLYEETKGDIFMMQQDIPKAKEAYALAIKAAPQNAPLTALQLKQADIVGDS